MKKISNMAYGARRMRKQVLSHLNARVSALYARNSWSLDPTTSAMAHALRDAIRAVEAMR